jgi:uncharacterized membrane-anchored protein YhcB (DUF1043 family)
MEDLRAFLQAEFEKIHNKVDSIQNKIDDEFYKIHHEFSRVNERLDNIEHELEDVKRVVRESAEDILENQVEEVARHNLHENKINMLEASVLDLKRRVKRLERANEGPHGP